MCLFLVYPNACFYISTTDTLCQSANVLLLLYSKHCFLKNLSATSVIVGEYPRTMKCNNYNKYYFAHQLQTLSSVSILTIFIVTISTVALHYTMFLANQFEQF